MDYPSFEEELIERLEWIAKNLDIIAEKLDCIARRDEENERV